MLIFLTITPIYTQQRVHQRNTSVSVSGSSVQHRVSLLTSMLVQNNPIAELATFQETWYARQFNVWEAGSAGIGFAIGFAYDLQGKQGALFRIQTFLESTGYIMGTFDIGTGIRIPLGQKGINFSTEFYFSMAVTGGELGIIGVIDQPSSFSTVVGLFGFKGRLALEIPLAKKMFLTPYLSYVAYPWHYASAHPEYKINGNSKGVTVDGLQIGLELGWKL
ncbi:MAG: hypothetical protein ACRC0X_00525 [Brevinema sp.]